MRDTNGIVAPLTARGYNIQGQLLPNAHIQYLSLSPSQFSINRVEHRDRPSAGDSLARVVASTPGSSRSPSASPSCCDRTASSTPTPMSVSTLHLSLSGGPDSNICRTTVGLLKHRPDTVGADSLARSYIVHYQITYPPAAAAGTGTIADTALFAYLITAPLGIPARTDTSNGNANTTRYVQFNIFKISPDTTDSIVVVATAQYPYKAAAIGGSPITWVICYSTGTATCAGAAQRMRAARRATASSWARRTAR